ncbi:MAG: hypothetical protein N2037_01535 [Acidimicrobiales bacterium]|nr:hypothetical protein [Acidimicrobiales bacterium]
MEQGALDTPRPAGLLTGTVNDEANRTQAGDRHGVRAAMKNTGAIAVSRRGEARKANPGRSARPPTRGKAGRPERLPAEWVERVFGRDELKLARVIVGFAWFLIELGCFYGGLVWLGAVFALVAAVGALQTCREWRRVGSQPNRFVAALGAGGMPLAAGWGIALCGLVLLALPVAAVAAALLRRRRRTPLLAAAGATVRSSALIGLAAAAPVLVFRVSDVGALLLIVLISGYDLGRYLVGAGSSSPLAGPIAGIVVAGVLTFSVSVAVEIFEMKPFADAGHAWVFGGVVAFTAPLGELVGSMVLPHASAPAPALRRLDSLMLAGPAWLFLLWNYLGVS